jgi:hypothetical protein
MGRKKKKQNKTKQQQTDRLSTQMLEYLLGKPIGVTASLGNDIRVSPIHLLINRE